MCLDLSDIELYYSPEDSIGNNNINITGDEVKHIFRVMRHSQGDKLFVTDGRGRIYETSIKLLSKDQCLAEISRTHDYANALQNITVCIPRLRNNDRLEFAIEKCIELGITNIVVFQSALSIGKGAKLERWNKLAVSAMKQSLHSYLPEIKYFDKFSKLAFLQGLKIFFNQYIDIPFQEVINNNLPQILEEKLNFVIGPEGGILTEETALITDKIGVSLSKHRLRSETAVITAVSIISQYLE